MKDAKDAKKNRQRQNKRSLSFTLIGAFIVFTTFIVKEAVGDHFKESAESINFAEQSYRNAMNTAIVAKEVVDAQFQLSRSQGPAQAGGDVRKDVTPELDSVRLNLFLLDNLNELNEKLPNNDALRAELNGHRATLQHLETTLTALSLLFSSPKFVTKEREDQLLDARKKVWNEHWQFIIPTGQAILNRAHALKEQREHFYQRWKTLSYVLYAIGWGIGLFGKLLGVGDIGGGE